MSARRSTWLKTASVPSVELTSRQGGTLVEALGSAVFHGGSAIGDVPALLKRVLQENAWREFETPTHEVVQYDRFETFVSTPPSRGLGADTALIRRIVANDPDALDLLDQALQNPASLHHTAVDIINGIPSDIEERPTGTSVSQAIRRLRKDRPDLLERVKAGELSANAAMKEAGFRKTPEKLTGTMADVGVLLSRMADEINSLKKRVDELELHVYAMVDLTTKPEE